MSHPSQRPPSDPGAAMVSVDAATGPAPAYRLYSASAVDVATLCGSIFAGLLLMSLNFRALGEDDRARRTLTLAAVVSVVTFVTIGLIPPTVPIPTSVYHGAQVLVAHLYVTRVQGDRLGRHVATGGRLYSKWRAAGIGLLCALGIVALFVAAGFVWSLWDPG